MKLGDYVVVWTDSVPVANALASTARTEGGELLAGGPVHDVSERNSRAAPAGLVIAHFGAADNAKAWFATVGDRLDGTALLVAGATDPVWWPPEMEAARPDRSHRAEFPRGSPWPVRVRLGRGHRSRAVLGLLAALPLDGRAQWWGRPGPRRSPEPGCAAWWPGAARDGAHGVAGGWPGTPCVV